MSRSFAVLVNPVSAGGRPLALLPAGGAELDRLETPHRVVETKSLEHAKEEARAAADAGETVMTMGGDGLVGPVAGSLRHSGTLAVIPAGRGNDFARVLGIPNDAREAVRLAVHGEERVLDLAQANGVPFATIATLGFDSVANRMANEARLVPGPFVYMYAGIRTLVSWRPASFEVTVDGQRYAFEGYGLSVGNTKAYGSGLLLLPMAEPDDGELDAILIEHHGKWQAAGEVFKARKGEHIDPNHMTVLRAKVVEVRSEPGFAVYADGDHITDTPVTITVEPRCLRIIAPAP